MSYDPPTCGLDLPQAECVAAAGDSAFTGGWKERGRVCIHRLSDGAENTRWIDILPGINAHRRASGEYLVFVGADYEAKVLFCHWKP